MTALSSAREICKTFSQTHKVDCNDSSVNKCYKKLAMKLHPDKNPTGKNEFTKLQAAYENCKGAFGDTMCGRRPRVSKRKSKPAFVHKKRKGTRGRTPSRKHK